MLAVGYYLGIYLISDGMKRDFGFEGVAALCQGCLQLKSLVLSDCFRIADMALKAIGKGLKDLQSLHLRNCPNLQEEAMGKASSKSFLNINTNKRPPSSFWIVIRGRDPA